MNDQVPRSAVAEKYQWNAQSVFADGAAWQAEYEALAARVTELEGFAGTFSQGPEQLLRYLTLEDSLSARLEALVFWAYMSTTVDTGDQSAVARNSQAGSLAGRYSGAVSFASPELLAIGLATLKTWMRASPLLAVYQHSVDDLFRKQKHVRSAEVEEVLGAAQDVFGSFYTIHTLQVDSDLKFQPVLDSAGQSHRLAQSTIENFLAHPDRTLRQHAWESFCDAHLANGPSYAATLVASVKKDVFQARMRGFGSSLEAALFGDNIPQAAFENTLTTFAKHQKVWHRYWRVRRKALGVEKLHHWDIWAPLTAKAPAVSYEQAIDWIGKAMAPLGKAYTEALVRGCLEQRWVDVYPTQGKGSGAFSGGSRGTAPFIMTSYSDDLSSVSTLTHELGHSLHSYHTWKRQPGVYSNYSIFVAEVASNFHQALTRAYLFEQQKDKDFQIALLEEALENFHRYFFIMPTLARFEREVHARVEAGRGVTAGDLNTLMADLFAEGYGGEVELDREREGSTWAQFNHLYANFYVFQYATGSAPRTPWRVPFWPVKPGPPNATLSFSRQEARCIRWMRCATQGST